MELKTGRQEVLIVNNVLKACHDIAKLNKTGYDFIYQCSGFIAHYNLHGFIDYYREPGSLRRDILNYSAQNQWDNFRPGEKNYEYYMQKKRIYNLICAGLKEE